MRFPALRRRTPQRQNPTDLADLPTLGPMGNIGKERRHIEVLPVREPAREPERPERAEPVREPAPAR